MLKYLGLISFTILAAGLAFAVFHWKGGLHMTFSQHIARQRVSIIYYSVLFALTLPLLSLFLIGWFVPMFQLPAWFTFFVVLSVTTQFLCTLIPEIEGWKTIAHRTLAGVSALSMLPLVMVLATSLDISQVGKVLAGVSLAGMLALLIVAAVGRFKHRYALLLQAGYNILFFVPIFYITYF